MTARVRVGPTAISGHASPRAFRRRATSWHHGRRTSVSTTAASSQDPPKFVRDSRDEARAAQPLDAGRRPEEINAFIGAIKGEIGGTSSSSSETSAVTLALAKEFNVRERVRVTEGRSGATKVQLMHPSGSYADVYLKGSLTVGSWVMANGGEVLFYDEGNSEKPGGISVQFPGITSKSEFRIIETGTVDDDTPFVTIELAGDNADSTFKLSVEISLASHNALKMKTTVHNTGSSEFEYPLGHNAHVAVSDAHHGDVYFIGFEDCVYLDKKLHSTKPRVRFTKDLDAMSERCFKLTGPTDKTYLCTNDHNTGVEVGTGCTVYAQNLSGETGCVDRVVFNPWEESPKAYRWYAGLGIGNFGKLRVAEPDSKSSTEVQFKVVDATPSVGIREDFELLEKINTRNMLSRRKIDLSDAELPSDLQ